MNKGIIYQLISCFLFAGYAFFGAGLSKSYPVAQVLFFKNFGAFALCLLFFPGSKKAIFERQGSAIFFIRGFLSCLATFIWLYCLSHLPVDYVTAINYTTPLFTLFLASLFLKEQVEKFRYIAFFISFIGVVTIFKTPQIPFHSFSLLCLLCPILWAVSNLCFKKAAMQKDEKFVVTKLSMAMTFLSFPFVLFSFEMPSIQDTGYFILMAILSLGVHFFQTLAYQRTELKTLQPFEFSRLLFVLMIQSFFPSFQFDGYIIAGACLIFLSGSIPIYIEYFSKKKADATAI